MSKYKVVIVDDHLLFAQSLRELVSRSEDFEVLEILKNGLELTKYFIHKRKRPDLVLLDIKMPVMDGIQTMQWLQEHQPGQKVLALTMEDDEETIIKMLRAGAKGYLLKDIHPDTFKYALETVMEQGFYYSARIESALKATGSIRIEKKLDEKLTDKEREFLKYTCSELTYKDIAKEMNVSPKTLENYREACFKKLEVKSRVGLVMYCMKNNLFKI